MTLWENVWESVKDQLPKREAPPRTFGSALGAVIAAGLIIAIWFPIRLVAELLKLVGFKEKPDLRRQSQELFRDAYDRALDLPTKGEFADSALSGIALPKPLHDALFDALRDLYGENMLLDVPRIPADLDSMDAVRWRDRLRSSMPRMNADSVERMRRACAAIVKSIASSLPKIAGDSEITSPLGTLVAPVKLIGTLASRLTADLFPAFADRYEDNIYRLSGIPRRRYDKPPKLLKPEDLDDPAPLLDRTPFAKLFSLPIGTVIPESARTSHHWIVGGSGAGKTVAMQYFIGKDLDRAVRGECSIVVLDSQHQLIDRLRHLKLFAPGQPLNGKLCLLDAADVEFPIAVNLFDMRLDQTASLPMLERQRILYSALEMYDFIIGSLLQAEMTSRQSTLFRFVTVALFAIPGATILTFHDILQNGAGRYQKHIDTLDEMARRFFATDFDLPVFRQTKEQVIARLWAILGNQTFLRMFSSPRSKVDLFAEINTPGKVILINAEKGLLKDEGTELFGRFFLALINQAAAQRSSLPPEKRLPCFVYVDECQNYIKNDPKIQVILSEARQQKVGVVLAHQYVGQLDTPVLRAVAANTSIKMASNLEGTDPLAMARDMGTSQEFIRAQGIGSFAVFVRNVTPTAIAMKFPSDPLARYPRMTDAESATVRQRNRDAYANPLEPERKKPASDRSSDRRGDDPPSGFKRDPDG